MSKSGIPTLGALILLLSALGCEAAVSLDGLTGGDPPSNSNQGDGSKPKPSLEGGLTTEASDDASTGPNPIDAQTGDTGAPPPQDASPSDAGGAIDTGTNPDVGTDAGTDSGIDAGTDAGTTTGFCASQSAGLLFCDDFDQGTLGAPFFQVTSLGGNAVLSNSGYTSSPNAMLVTVSPNGSSPNVDIAGYQKFTSKTGVAGTYSFSFDVRVETADTTPSSSDAVIGAIQLFDTQGHLWTLELEVFSSGGALGVNMPEDGTTFTEHAVPGVTVPINGWTRATIKLVLGTPAGGSTGNTGVLLLNGTQVASESVNVTTSSGTPEIILGATYAAVSSSGWKIRYDNVTFAFN